MGTVCWSTMTKMEPEQHPSQKQHPLHFRVIPDKMDQEQHPSHTRVIPDQPPSLSTDTTVLIIFLLGCVVLGLCIKLCVVLLNKWRKKKEMQQFERKSQQ